MARARAIETRLEQLVPSMEEYFVVGCFTRAELRDIVRQRTHHEYRLVANPLLLLDIRNAIAYEEGLEQRLADHVAATKVTLKHRWVIVDRIDKIFQIGMRRLKDASENEALRNEYVAFLTKHNRHTSLSRHYAHMIQRYPMKPHMWIEGAMWEVQCGNVDNARNIILQAQRTLTRSADIYIAALSVELEFAKNCIDELQRAARKETPEGQPLPDICAGLQRENEASFEIVVNLALAQIVLDTTVEARAFTAEFVRRAYALLERYPFSAAIAVALAERLAANAEPDLVAATVVGVVKAAAAGIMPAAAYINDSQQHDQHAVFAATTWSTIAAIAALLPERPSLDVQQALHGALLAIVFQRTKAGKTALSAAEASAALRAIATGTRLTIPSGIASSIGCALVDVAKVLQKVVSLHVAPKVAAWDLDELLPALAPADRTAVVAAAASTSDGPLTVEQVRGFVKLLTATAAAKSVPIADVEQRLRRVEKASKEVLVEAWPLYCLFIRLAASDASGSTAAPQGSSDDDDEAESSSSPREGPVVRAARRGLRAIGSVSHGALGAAKLVAASPAYKRQEGLYAMAMQAVGKVLRTAELDVPLNADWKAFATKWLHSGGRSAFKRLLDALPIDRRASAVADCLAVFRGALSYPPVPRELHLAATAFAEAAGEPANKIRSAYDFVLAGNLPSLLLGVDSEAHDWLARINFEREVSRDLVEAKRVFDRAVKQAKNPRAVQQLAASLFN